MTEIKVRQRNQVTIPKAIAEAAGIEEGTVCDMQYANGVITIRLPEHRPHIDVMQYAGIGRGLWGATTEEIDRNLREMRDEWDRQLPRARRLLGRLVYLDSNVLIYLLDANPTYLTQVERLLAMASAGELRATTGDLTVTEILVRPLASGDEAAVSRIAGFLDSGLVDIRSHTRGDFEMAARIRAAHRTSMPDALHVATALNAGCKVPVTNDQRMPSVPGLEIVRLHQLEHVNG